MTDNNGWEFGKASYATCLNLPQSGPELLETAARAVHSEYRDSVRWKRLRCRNVSPSPRDDTRTVYELEIGHAVEFDWTWEGAAAFRPLSLRQDDVVRAASLFDDGIVTPDIDDSIVWTGKILEVDEAAGRIFIAIENPDYPPRRGSFYVRPFEYLAFLDSLYNTPAFAGLRRYLPERLAASEGGIHPHASDFSDVGLDELKKVWKRSWGFLWGPPGTGKTYNLGRQIARVLDDPSERILVVSTTNRATDQAAKSIGEAVQERNNELLDNGQVVRIGNGASLKTFEEQGLVHMLRSARTDLLELVEALAARLAQTTDSEERALIQNEIRATRKKMRDSALRSFLDESIRVVVCTSFKAVTLLNHATVREDAGAGFAPFTTLFIDEAGLISRAAVCALSLLASRRVVQIGDPKQLAPISRISRILEPAQAAWLACSGLSHLTGMASAIEGAHVLTEQRRMHRQVCDVVSAYQYDASLTTAGEVAARSYTLPAILKGQPRAIWYVLDEDCPNLPAIRAERGPGNRSWVRKATMDILKKLFSGHEFQTAKGLYISPFKAQAREVHAFLAPFEPKTWTASTVHSQQGAEADIVIFDSVNAGSCAWPYDEWKRLVNVALSRAKEAVIVLASRDEMEEPYLSPLLKHLSPQIVKRRAGKFIWQEVPKTLGAETYGEWDETTSNLLGGQIAKRKALRPVLSREQERLCNYTMDGKPRLVRGVAGSGKTVVLAHWLVRTVQRLEQGSHGKIWVVFANKSLRSLITGTIQAVCNRSADRQDFQWERVEFSHIMKVLKELLPEVGLSYTTYGDRYDYDGAAKAYLDKMPADRIAHRCEAIFIDEAQDMGSNTLRLLSALVRKTDPKDENSRSVNIFYDNAQNIYGRSMPKWSDFDLDMRGRSTIMKESFRSTRPIVELALNVLYRLQPPETNQDHKELVESGLVEEAKRNNAKWWNVRFNQVHGPKPVLHEYDNMDQEFEAIGRYCRELIEKQKVLPSDIALIYNGKNVPGLLQRKTMSQLKGLGLELLVKPDNPQQRSPKTLLATTTHSFKGFDAEIVIIPAVEQFRALQEPEILANTLYVAMTRARSMLVLFTQKRRDKAGEKIYAVIRDCLTDMNARHEIEANGSRQDAINDIARQIGEEHIPWLSELWAKYTILQETARDTISGKIIADPLFTVKNGEDYYSCYGKSMPPNDVRQKLVKYGIKVIEAGQEIGSNML